MPLIQANPLEDEMKTMKILTLVVLLVSILSVQLVQAQDHPAKAEHPATIEHPASPDGIVAIAASAGNFTTFLAAVEAAGLEEKLNSKGPFTVFAPTDEAFAKLPKGKLEDLLKPANKAQLAGLLACHVVPGMIMAEDCKTMKATNVSGQDLSIKVTDDGVTVDGAKVVKADLVASNGVIHAIDTVIVPASAKTKPASEAPKDHPAH